MLWTVEFWRAGAERAIKTFAQALVAVLGAGATGLLDVDWAQAFSVAALAAVLSVHTSVASAGVSNAGPSLADEALVPARHAAEGDVDALVD